MTGPSPSTCVDPPKEGAQKAGSRVRRHQDEENLEIQITNERLANEMNHVMEGRLLREIVEETFGETNQAIEESDLAVGK